MVARDRSDFIAEIDKHSRAADFFRGLVASLALPAPPRALLVVSAHWEERAAPTVMTAPRPGLLFDYGGFPPETYELKWPVSPAVESRAPRPQWRKRARPQTYLTYCNASLFRSQAPGDPALAARVRALLSAAGVASREDAARGFDHGVFVPLMLSFPQADVPCVQLSLHASLDPALHLKIGAALAPLRAEGVLVIGSGFLTHNMRGGFAAPFTPPFAWAVAFERMVDAALLEGPPAARAARVAALEQQDAKLFRQAHPREEHFLPIVVAAAAGLAPQAHANAQVEATVATDGPRAAKPVKKIFEQIANGGGSLACYRFDGE